MIDLAQKPSNHVKNFYFPKEIEEHLKVKITVGRILVTVFAVVALAVAWIFVPSPKANAAVKENSTYTLDQSFIVDFSRPVKRNEISYSISPDVQGTWSWQKSYFGSKHLFTRLVFSPQVMYQPETKYNVKISNIKGMVTFDNAQNNYSYSFKTQSIPKVAKVDPAKEAKDLKIDSEIRVKLDQANNNLADFTFETDPKIDFDISFDKTNNEYLLKPKTQLAQGTTYNLKIYRTILIYDNNQKKVIKRNNPEVSYEGGFTTQAAPGLASFTPTGDHVLVTTNNIRAVFSSNMDRKSVESNIEISPNIAGKITWADDKTLNYNLNQNLSYGTTYSFKIKKGAKNSQGGYLVDDVSGTFTTIGSVYASFSPGNGVGAVRSNSSIYVYFDQPVDHTSAQNHFSVSGDITGGFTWSGNTMTFTPSGGLQKNSGYTATLSAGVKSINGLDSARSFSTTFYTEQNYVKLNIPLDYQDYPLSCEVASLKMALRYRGIPVSEDTLMGIVGYDPTPHIGNTWGDPYNAFVGSLTGKDGVTGYGVYWGPIERAARNYRSARAATGWSAAQLANELQNGNPIVFWGVYGNGYPIPWYTTSGKYINAWMGEHVRLLIGFSGPASNPTSFIINDPIVGQFTWSANQLMSNMSAFGNAGVVVY